MVSIIVRVYYLLVYLGFLVVFCVLVGKFVGVWVGNRPPLKNRHIPFPSVLGVAMVSARPPPTEEQSRFI